MDADTDPLHSDISTTIPDENEGETDLKHMAVERVLRLFFLGENYCIILLRKMYLAFINKLATKLPPGQKSHPNSLLFCK